MKADGKTTSSYIRRSDFGLARKLAIKTLCQKRLHGLKHNADLIRRFLDHYQDDIPLNRLSPGFQELLTGINVYPDLNEKLKNWQNEPYDHCPHHPEALTIAATGNTFVRSKSEAFIASSLSDKGIPFRYECGANIAGIVVYPDFTIRHPLSGRLYLWEHFGLIDKPHYLDNALDKLRLYIRGGFIPGDNLIMTCETSEAPLSFSFIHDLIEYYFLC